MRPRSRSMRATVALVLLMLFSIFPASAQESTPRALAEAVTESTVDFPAGIDFSTTMSIPNDFEVLRVEFLYRPATDRTLNLAFVPDNEITSTAGAVSADVSIDLQTNFLPTGIDLTFFWRVIGPGGRAIDSMSDQIGWYDPRFEWTEYATDRVRLHTYGLGPEFAQATADTAQATADSLAQRFGLASGQPISIWIYDSTTDFRPAQRSNSREAVAGASYSSDYVIHAVIRDGDEREVGRTITHEVSHQVLYQATRNPYSTLPLWFDEGMATHAQTTGIDGYLPLAISAANSGSLFSLKSLESAFPFQPADAPIAYALSWSAVEYIEVTWGDGAIMLLLDQFSKGASTDDTVMSALGITITQLDEQLLDWLLRQSRAELPGISDVQ